MRVLIIGCGRMGQTRAAAAASLGAEIIGCVDIDPAAAERLASRYPTARPFGPDASIDWSELDRAFVCTPPGSRGPELHAVSAGVPVLIEKPVALSAPAADDLVRLAHARGVTVAVGYMNRYRPAVHALKEALDTDPPFAITCHWVAAAYQKDWWLDPRMSGGPINDQLSHLVDICRFIAGDFVEVAALSADGERQADRAAAAAVALRLEKGGCVTMAYSFLAREKHITLEAFSAGGAHRLDGWDFTPPGVAPPADRDAIFLEETAAFLGVRGDLLCDAADAQRTQAVVDAVKRSVLESAVVPIS